ncbi:hypothetical protein AAMO2058_000174800 [Amorphochlora amoebiformis]
MSWEQRLAHAKDAMARRMDDSQQLATVVGHYIRKRDWWGSFRSADQCFALSNFSPPKDMDEVKLRLLRNITYFLSNYVAFTLFVLLFGVFTSTSTLICVLILCMAWTYGLKLKSIRLGDMVLTEKSKLWLMTVISLLILLLVAGPTILWIIVFSSLPIMGHATVHLPMSPSMSKKDDDIDPENPPKGIEMEDKGLQYLVLMFRIRQKG